MSSYVHCRAIRTEQVERAGGEQVVEAGMGVTKGRFSQIEQGKISGQDVLARYAAAIA